MMGSERCLVYHKCSNDMEQLTLKQQELHPHAVENPNITFNSPQKLND